MMSPNDVLEQITVHNGIVTSKSTGKQYPVKEFIETISVRLKWTKKQKREFESHFIDCVAEQSEKSKFVEEIIDKYDFKFSDGVYFINGTVFSQEDIYRLFWKEEKLLPTETDYILENVEKISERIPLQIEIFNKIIKRTTTKKISGESLYLKSLHKLYPDTKWEDILYNILVPNTRPLFHILYDDGVGGTGKSTLLEVLTKIVGEENVSNVLLDQFGNRFVFANMLGKYLNIGDDNGKNDELQNVGTLKSIVTGNRVTIDRKNISPIEVRIFAKQLFATNILPYIDFTDGGIMRRLNIIPMNKVIPENMELCELDEEELDRIVNDVLTKGKDLISNNNILAITNHPLYRFYKDVSKDFEIKNYENYKYFCDKYGFKRLNIVNFEVKSKFIKAHIKSTLIETEEKDPF